MPTSQSSSTSNASYTNNSNNNNSNTTSTSNTTLSPPNWDSSLTLWTMFIAFDVIYLDGPQSQVSVMYTP